MSEYSLEGLIQELAGCPKEGSRDLDAKIGAHRDGPDRYAIEFRPGFYKIPGAGSVSSESIEALHYTSNIGAASLTIPNGWYGRLDPCFNVNGPVSYKAFCLRQAEYEVVGAYGLGPTAPIALLIAAFKAMQAEGRS